MVLYFGFTFIIACIFGYFGDKKKIGGLAIFLITLIFSPLVGLIVLLASKDAPKSYKCRNCGYVSTDTSYYCPRCLKDNEGFTAEENKVRFQKPLTAVTNE